MDVPMSAQAAKMLRWLPALTGWLRSFRPIGLRARIAILVSSGLLVLIGIFVFIGLSALRVSNEREIEQKAVLAQMVANELDSRLEQAATLTSWTAPELGDSLDAADEANIRAEVQAASPRVASASSGLLVFDRSGRFLLSDPSSVPAGASLLDPTITASILDGKPWAAGWVRAGSAGYALVVTPARDRTGVLTGYLASLVNFSQAALVQQLGQGPLVVSGRVDVVDREGVLLSGGSEAERIGPPSHSALFEGLTAGSRPTVQPCYDCHETQTGTAREREIMAFAPMKSTDWSVVLRQPEDDVLEPNRMLQAQVLTLGATALLFAMFMVWFTTRSVLGPIESMNSAARRIAEGDLEEAVSVRGSDEIGDLGRTLEMMRVRLKRSLGEIKSYNTELNQRVAERTAELERSRDELQESRDNMRLLVDRLSTLNAMAAALNSSLELGDVLNRALENALALTGMGAGAIYLVHETTGELALAAHHGISRQAAEVAANLGLSASLCATAAESGEPLVVENTGRYARGSRSILLAEKMRCMVRLPFKSSGRLLGTVCLVSPNSRTFSRAEMDLLNSVGSQIAAAVEKARLYEEVQRKEKLRGELLQKLISAQEDERKRIARELHDETSQALAALAVAVETAAGQCAAGEDVGPSIKRMKSLAIGTLEEVHRLIFDLRPTLLDDLGLIAALRWYAETRLGEAGIRVRLEIAGEERRLGQMIETTLYRVVQEAVNNVANHSGAQSFVATLVLRSGSLSLTMADDGWGFDLADVAKSADTKRGLGLMGMKERVELLGGTFNIQSELGQGTRIMLEVPLESEVEDGD